MQLPPDNSPSSQHNADNDLFVNDREAMGRAMETYRRYLLLVANKEIDPALRPKGGASDLVQETFLEAYRDMDQFTGRSTGELKGWLKRILRNNVANFVRSYRESIKRQISREISLDRANDEGHAWDGLAASTPSPSNQAILSEQNDRLEQARGRLPERDQNVLTWRNDDHCHWDEIGRRLGGTPEKARKIWSRAVVRLRIEVGDDSGSSMGNHAHA
jgi:RNA polymerase sigma-70 factor, ECF subfamily